MTEYAGTTTDSSSEEAKIYLEIIASYWPIVLGRAIILLTVGICFIAFPETTLNSFAILFGVFCIIESLVSLLKLWLVCKRGAGMTALSFTYGVTFLLNLSIGIVSVAWPGLTTKALLILISVWFIIVGIVEVGLSCLFREKTWILLSGGMLCVMFGFILLIDLDRGTAGMSVLIGIVLILFATQVLCFACRLRKIHDQIKNEESASPTGVLEPVDASVV
mmetsp:Transcript_26739/g.39549  ORF Transcript_26739/g.39549 Transcript_26739/m.39549 type:complete len:220 (+) Transcript_26739:180-839(+)|eukprot:CAMPEP_0194215778 /NCGR_PEP_ID=MMETSP0156-20130528/17801_1 /TAXON_ID=33649 /ORGANISM="Thalassionema nitzschioides, Strain L26-B" /LENGTH=219 /DNA_ID=CAMNT_0038944387 /DNA_START=96 /DNA_END=755 /DNA_ORIENTATION=-